MYKMFSYALKHLNNCLKTKKQKNTQKNNTAQKTKSHYSHPLGCMFVLEM